MILISTVTGRGAVVKRVARGFREPGGKIQIAVRVTQDVFHELRRQAVLQSRTLGALAESYVTCGVEVDRDWEGEDAPGTLAKNANDVCVIDVSRAPAAAEAFEATAEHGWVREPDGTLTRIKGAA